MMEYLAWFVIFFTCLQFLVALINLVFRPNLAGNKKPVFNGLISVLIPARNEEHNIVRLLIDLQHQTYKNVEILVYDDESTDNTATLVGEMMKYDKRIRLIEKQKLPSGWLGKNFGCFQLASHAKGEYLIFVDADVRLGADTITNTVHLLQKTKSQLLSVFPRQLLFSLGEKAVVPVMNYILLTLLPLVFVRYSHFKSFSAANGQFMLFESSTYKKLQPHSLLRTEKVEDIRIARLYKEKRLEVLCLAANSEIECRMYNNYKESIQGFTKNIAMFFGNSYLLALLFWVITTFGFLSVLFYMSLSWFLMLSLLALATRIMVSVQSGQSIIANLALWVPQQFNIGIILYKSVINNIKGQSEWKGRVIN